MLNGSRLREVRKAKGLTQTELGDLIGVGKSAICCYEKETRNPTLEAVIVSRKLKKKKRGKCEIHTLRPGIWQENLKN